MLATMSNMLYYYIISKVKNYGYSDDKNGIIHHGNSNNAYITIIIIIIVIIIINTTINFIRVTHDWDVVYFKVFDS